MGTDHLKARCICITTDYANVRKTDTTGCPVHEKPVLVIPGQFDEVQKPRHYNSHPSGIQAIEVGRHLTGDWFNVFKYVFRADLKNGRQDIDKALWYAKDGFEHGIPIQLSSWSDQQDEDIQNIIINETDEHRRSFFAAIGNNDRAWAMAEVEFILEAWPTNE